MNSGPVGDHQRERVAAPDAERGAARRRSASTRVAQLRPRPGDLVVLRADRDPVRVVLDREAERLGDRRGAHGASPLHGRTLPQSEAAVRRFGRCRCVRPTRNSMITSAKPTNPARSMTLNGIALPRTFSASAQKMCPPSSGRNGNRLMTPSDSEMKARIDQRGAGRDLDRLARRLVAADDAADLLALLGHEDLRDVADRVALVTVHISLDREAAGAHRARGLLLAVLVVGEAEAVALGLARVVERLAGDGLLLAVAATVNATGVPLWAPTALPTWSTCSP